MALNFANGWYLALPSGQTSHDLFANRLKLLARRGCDTYKCRVIQFSGSLATSYQFWQILPDIRLVAK
jgi:hypothetical protein